MDFVTIKFIGIILLFNTTPNSFQNFYTALIPDGRNVVEKCEGHVDPHVAVIKIDQEPQSGTDWPCADASNPCKTFSINQDNVEITGVSNSTVGVTKNHMRRLLRLRDYFKSLPDDIDISGPKSKSLGSVKLSAGVLTGVEKHDERSAMLTFTPTGSQPAEIVIQSYDDQHKAKYKIVLKPGATITFEDEPVVTGTGGPIVISSSVSHWFLHYALFDQKPLPTDCIPPRSRDFVANKECSATTYP